MLNLLTRLTVVAALLACLLPSQQQNDSAATTTTANVSLAPGQTLRDRQGRVVTNAGTNQNGRLVLTVRGKMAQGANGPTVGEIVEVTNPASQGTVGPIEVDTGGCVLTINLEKNGGNPNPIQTNVSGGNATVNVNGRDNNTTVGGADNTVRITGANSSGTGTAGSSGTVSVSGSGSSFQSGGGNWRTTSS